MNPCPCGYSMDPKRVCTCLPDARFAIGLFFSVHHITAVVVDILGNIRCEKRIRRKADLHDESYLKALAGLADEVLRESGLPDEALIGVGISVQSLVSEDGEYFEHGRHERNGCFVSVKRGGRYYRDPSLSATEATLSASLKQCMFD